MTKSPSKPAAPTGGAVRKTTHNVDLNVDKSEDTDALGETDLLFWLMLSGEDEDEDDRGEEATDGLPAEVADEDVDVEEDGYDSDDDDDDEQVHKTALPPARASIEPAWVTALEDLLENERGRPLNEGENYTSQELLKAVKDVVLKLGAVARSRHPQEARLRERYNLCLSAIRNNEAYNLHGGFTSIVDGVTHERLFKAFYNCLEDDEVTLLTADKPPTATTLRKRSLATPGDADPSWALYTLALFRRGRLPIIYEGSATCLSLKAFIGGVGHRYAGHKTALRGGKRSFFYNCARKFAGRLAIFSNWRVDVSKVPQRRSAFLTGLRMFTQYCVEAVLHDWKDTFDKPHGTVWASRYIRGTNWQSPAVQAVTTLSFYDEEERFKRANASARRYQSSAKGLETRKVWDTSETGKESARKRRATFYAKGAFEPLRKRYRASEKGQATQAAYNAACKARRHASLALLPASPPTFKSLDEAVAMWETADASKGRPHALQNWHPAHAKFSHRWLQVYTVMRGYIHVNRDNVAFHKAFGWPNVKQALVSSINSKIGHNPPIPNPTEDTPALLSDDPTASPVL